jgi:exonuclease VII small subunit
MTTKSRIPDAETRARAVHKLKEICRELEVVELMLDEAIALVDRDLREQRLARLQKRASLAKVSDISETI